MLKMGECYQAPDDGSVRTLFELLTFKGTPPSLAVKHRFSLCNQLCTVHQSNAQTRLPFTPDL